MIYKIIRKVFFHIYFSFDRVRCSRFMGVSIGIGSKIYGNSPSMWGTEPFLIRIGSNVHITDGCRFVTHDGGTLILRRRSPELELTFPITVGDNVYIGIRSLIMPGVKIGNNVIIGANSVVTKDIPDNTVCVGSPARKIKTVEQYYVETVDRSIGLGHLDSKSKEQALRKLYSQFIGGKEVV